MSMSRLRAKIEIPSNQSTSGLVAAFRKFADACGLEGAIDLEPGRPGGGTLSFRLTGEDEMVDRYLDFLNDLKEKF